MNKDTKIALGIIGGILVCGIIGIYSTDYNNTNQTENIISVKSNIVTKNTILNELSIDNSAINWIKEDSSKETNTISKIDNTTTNEEKTNTSSNKSNTSSNTTSNKSNNTKNSSTISSNYSEKANTSNKTNSNSNNTNTSSNKQNTTIVYITNSGSKYHRSGCFYLRKSKIETTLDKAKKQGFSACSRCNP